MMICRCAWHRRYFGYPLVNGVVTWRGFTVRFTDGICPRCLERFRDEHRTFLHRREDRAKPELTDVVPNAASGESPV